MWRASACSGARRSGRFADACAAHAIARDQGYRSIAFPLIGAGTGGYSPEKVLEIMRDKAGKSEYDGEVRIVRYRRLDAS
jgi:O-acetyl-ADP-ribose deacetylase (regulator of RNase III)